MTIKKGGTWILAATLVGAAMTASAQETSISDPATANAPKGKISIVNETGAPISVFLGEAKLGTIPPRGRQEFKEIPGTVPIDITTGSRVFTASNGTGDRYWGPKEIHVEENGTEWKVSESAKGGVRVVNNSTEAIAVLIAEKVLATAAPGKEATFSDMKDGRYRFSAKSTDGKKQYSARYYEIKGGAVLIDWKIGTAPAGAAAPASGS